jgi:hypothetical protein
MQDAEDALAVARELVKEAVPISNGCDGAFEKGLSHARVAAHKALGGEP